MTANNSEIEARLKALEESVCNLRKSTRVIKRLIQREAFTSLKLALMHHAPKAFKVDSGKLNVKKRDQLVNWEAKLLGASAVPQKWKDAIRITRRWEKDGINSVFATEDVMDAFKAFEDAETEDIQTLYECVLEARNSDLPQASPVAIQTEEIAKSQETANSQIDSQHIEPPVSEPEPTDKEIVEEEQSPPSKESAKRKRSIEPAKTSSKKKHKK